MILQSGVAAVTQANYNFNWLKLTTWCINWESLEIIQILREILRGIVEILRGILEIPGFLSLKEAISSPNVVDGSCELDMPILGEVAFATVSEGYV